MTHIDVSIDPTDLMDNMAPDLLEDAVRETLETEYPDAKIEVQIGFRQGDGWAKMDGRNSLEVDAVIQAMDWTDESLYAEPEVEEDEDAE
jgi:hypothetical protein